MLNQKPNAVSRRWRIAGWVLMLSGWLVTIALLIGLASSPRPMISEGAGASTDIPLPHTDGAGSGLDAQSTGALDRASAFIARQRACDGPCVTPFGARLGAADGVEARSNCVSTCLRPDSSFVDRGSGEIRVGRASPDQERFEYAGLTYQCVEFARRWWIRQRGLTFGDVPTAADIFSLTEGRRLPGREPVVLGRSLNGLARRAPERGDLIIYAADSADPDWRAGHVAVVVAVDREQGWVALAEENYDNRPWQVTDAYARRIQLFAVGGRYSLVDVAPDAAGHPDGGRILGWVYPLPQSAMDARE
jgi:hypothetical protein